MESGGIGDAIVLSEDSGRALEACSPQWISQQVNGTDATSGGRQGDLGVAFLGPESDITWSPWPGSPGAWNCQAVSIFKVVTNSGSVLPGGIKHGGPQIHCVCARVYMRSCGGMSG